ncbi:MAG: hypothetical protein WBP22_03225 [Candidatus Saccharimonas sp.]
MLNIDKMQDKLHDTMTQAAPEAQLSIEHETGTTRLVGAKFTLVATISPKEVSYHLSTTISVGGIKPTISGTADYYPYLGDKELERVASTIYDELLTVIKNIKQRTIYVGCSGKKVYIAWKTPEWRMRTFKRSWLGSIDVKESIATQGTIDDLDLCKLL